MTSMMQGPVVTELGRRWVTGQVSSDEYFDRVWREALTRATRHVRTRLRRAGAGEPAGGSRDAVTRRVG